jgi:hypothetical protein
MPTTHHSSGAERNMQAEHTHEVDAASHNKSTNLSGNEEMKIADEHNREKQEHLAQLKKADDKSEK